MRRQVSTFAVLALLLLVVHRPQVARAKQASFDQPRVVHHVSAGENRVLLQQIEISPAARAAAQLAAREVGRLLRPSRTPSTDGAHADIVADSADAESSAEPNMPKATEPVVKLEDEPELEEEVGAQLSSIDYARMEKVQYSSEGLSLQAPIDWEVTPGTAGIVFNIAAPGTDFVAELQSGDGQEIPGASAVVLFLDQPEVLVRQIDMDARLVDVATLMTSQQLPVVKIAFAADFASGALYIVSPGADAYLLIAAMPGGDWEQVEAGVDLMVESIFFAPALITLTTAESGDLPFSDLENTLEVVVPEKWQVTESNLETLPLIVVNPDFRFVGVLGFQPGSEEEFNTILDRIAIPESGELDGDLVGEVVGNVLGLLDLGAEDLILDEAHSEIFVNEEDIVTMRAGGTLNLDEDLYAPVILYVSPRLGGVAVMAIFGEISQALQDEAAVLSIIDSIQALQ